MFLSAVARPRWDDNKEEWFDGKIGTWHFTETVPAQCRSSRRDAGTPVMKTVSVIRETYKKMLIGQVIPAIRCQAPRPRPSRFNRTMPVRMSPQSIQTLSLPAKTKAGTWSFFRAIQTLQAEKHSSCLEDIVTATEAAWADVSSTTLNKNFLTLQRCLQEVILNQSGNDYKIPHMKKDVLHARDYSTHMNKLATEILESMQMGAICTQIEALKVDIDVDVHADIAAALGLIQLLD
ncbi:hypothetical protein H257_15032 [Aphanomyces astaci]|uniref:Uncharacterized protein n=1 Tax=Aphanomyces astaci TaxID=112090 RepID=W4FRC5_APHAT|nr:hypothetical protein H257_15032 [Aphanomyces astaci]ETV69203.1 hypothetical protein H257_15032 [Aphanomyces astaci]|eukprot:XP_009841305.1 hypothetical protein H257_15032 [Aphanomyces astaci]